MAIVLLNREDYDKKMLELLKDTKTYTKLDKDPTNEYKNELIGILRRWQKEQPIPKDLKDKIYPTSQEVPKIYGTPKIHKTSFPLRTIVSSIGSVSYYAAKIIADILNPLVGNTIHHIKNSGDFVTKIQDLEVPPGQAIVSYDVSALFTSIPVPDAMKVIKDKIKSDDTLSNRTPLSPDQVLELLRFCLETTYFSFKGNFYKQKHGAAMGSPVSPIVANIYMESFEKKALSTASNPPSIWLRYVDDTFVKIRECHIDDFTKHINSIDKNINFTIEREENSQLPFLDTCVHINDDGSTRATVYRKPTHTDQYLNFQSNHHLQHKRSVVRTLLDRTEKLVTTEIEKKKEIQDVKQALQANGYKSWTFQIQRPKRKDSEQKEKGKRASTINIPLPYVQGISEKLTRIFKEHGVGTYHKPYNTIKSLLVHPKDKTPDMNKCGVVYEIACPECDEKYIGETARAMSTRLKEHLKPKAILSAVAEHCLDQGHNIKKENVKIIAREDHLWRRKIKESIEIRTRQPTLNCDQGYDLPRIYDQLLLPRDHL